MALLWEIGQPMGKETTKPKPRRGRPVQIAPERREAMVLDAVAVLLCDHPLDAISMADVAAHVSMSKRTLYAMFPSREAMLLAALARMVEQVFRPLTAEESELPLESRLRRLLTVNKMPGLERNSIELLRAVVAGQKQFPELARRVHRAGWYPMVGLLRQELCRAVARGEIAKGDVPARQAAELLLDMTFEDVLPHLLDPVADMLGPEQRAQRRDLALGVFLRGISGIDATG